VKRRFEVLILPALLLAAIALPIPLADNLPDPIATHWGLDGRPDGSLDATVFWLTVTGVWVALWALLVARARKGGPLPEAVPVLAAGGFIAALMITTVAANDGAASWRDGGEVGVVGVLIAVGAGLLLGGLALLLERGHESEEPAGRRAPRRSGWARASTLSGWATPRVPGWRSPARSARLASPPAGCSWRVARAGSSSARGSRSPSRSPGSRSCA
jgi:hypothetical protein